MSIYIRDTGVFISEIQEYLYQRYRSIYIRDTGVFISEIQEYLYQRYRSIYISILSRVITLIRFKLTCTQKKMHEKAYFSQ